MAAGPETRAAAAGPARWQALALGAVFVAACVAYGLVWEPTHDGSVTFHTAIGVVPIFSYPTPAVPITQLYEILDARQPLSPGEVIDSLMVENGMHPPAYYLALNGWARAVGTGQLALNAPAIAAGLLTLLGLARLARRLVPERGSQWTAALLVLSPWFLAFTNFTRPYAIALGVVVWSTVAVLACGAGAGTSETQRNRWRAAFVALSLLGIYCIYHYVFALLWQGALLAWLAWRSGPTRRAKELGALAAMAALIALGYAPWLPRLAAHLALTGSGTYYFSGMVEPADWSMRLGWLLSYFALGESWRSQPHRIALAVLGLATLLAALRAFSPARLRALGPAERAAWVTLPLLPAAILATDLWRGTQTLFWSKSSFAVLPFLLLFVVRAWSAGAPRLLARLGLGLWLLLFASAALVSVTSRAKNLTPFETLAAHLAQTDLPQHTVVLSTTAVGYTLPLLRTLRSAGVRHVRITHASSEDLPRLVSDAKRDPQLRGLTLVNMRVLYFPTERWESPLLNQVALAARTPGGFSTAPIEHGKETPPAPLTDRRMLWITRPALQTNYFSR